MGDIPGYIREAHLSGPKIAAIGGGTGLSTMLRGLKEVSANITAIVNVSDDGGSSGYLRHDRSMPPPGDIRNCMMALANTEPLMEQLMNYRFEGGAFGGHSFGNLLLAALNGICPTFDQAVERMHDVLAVTGRVMPVTTSDVYLEAEFENGAKVLGESKIFNFKKEQNCRIRCVRLVPQNPPALPSALNAIREADYIVLGPGSLYTSIIPNLLVDGVVNAIMEADALKVYICNVMTQEGESEGYTAYDHVHELMAHSREGLFQYCLVNDAPVPTEILERYKSERAEYLKVDIEAFKNSDIEIISRPLFGEQNNYARHNPRRLAYELYRLMVEIKPRDGDLNLMDSRMLRWLESRL
jgi:uncharacterized cofD-like protein